MLNWTYNPSKAPVARIRRRMMQYAMAAPVQVCPDRPVVTFTFDDFPKSALNGADIVEAVGGKAGFYACTSMLGRRSPVMGEMFDAGSLNELTARGHEIGAHTHDHIDCARATVADLEKSVSDNLMKLADAGHTSNVASFAFPYGETSFAAKTWMADIFATSRGIMPGVNVGRTDRAQLKSTELLNSAASLRRAREHLKSCLSSNGWLIFFTHDVQDAPSPYGVSTAMLKDLAKEAVDGGAVLAAPTLGAVLSGVID